MLAPSAASAGQQGPWRESRSGQAGHFLDHAEPVAAPTMAAVDGLLAVELTVGLPGHLSLTGGGRDLDNYLFPLAQRLGPARICLQPTFTGGVLVSCGNRSRHRDGDAG